MRNNGRAVIISAKDNVATIIPSGRRFALRGIPAGGRVVQYGAPFALSKGIKPGEAVSASNTMEIPTDYARLLRSFKPARVPKPGRGPERFFMAYRRKDGSAGTRNYFLVVPTSMCAADVASRIAAALDRKKPRGVDGVLAAAHSEGCGSSDGVIIDRLLLTLKNTVLNPNVCGALAVDLGCEKVNSAALLKYIGKTGKPVKRISIQECGGTLKAAAAGIQLAGSMLRSCAAKRVRTPLSKLVIGTECGASDSFSGITANPLIGSVVDRIIGAGGSAILSETPELLGAEASLLARMPSRATAKKFLDGVKWYLGLAKKLNVSMSGNFVPGNAKGGLINPALKSLGAVSKGGTSPVVDFVDYAELLVKPGLNIMNGPGNDLESMTGLAASGANMILFSTGGGATEGNLIVPVIKISSTTALYRSMKGDMDLDAGVMLDPGVPLARLSGKLLDLVIATASGRKTRAEALKKRSFQVWTAGKLSL